MQAACQIHAAVQIDSVDLFAEKENCLDSSTCLEKPNLLG